MQYKALHLDGDTSFFGIYDDQEGSDVPKFCGKHLHEEIQRIEISLRNQKNEEEDDNSDDLCNAIKDGFLRMDEMMKDPSFWIELNGEGITYDSEEELRASLDMTGCHACVVFVRKNNLIVANVGSTRCYISRKDEYFALTTDHRSSIWSEKKRIHDAGGFIKAGEVRGQKLDFSRAIGYMRFKQNENLSPMAQLVIAKPVVRLVKLRRDIEFIILAPKIFWTGIKKEVAMQYARVWIKEGFSLSQVCDKLRMVCLSKLSTKIIPNVVVMIIQLEAMQSEVPEEDSNTIFKHRSVVRGVEDPVKWKKLSKTYVLARDREPAEMRERLRIAILRSVENGNDDGASFTLPSRADHLYGYIPQLQQVCLRRGKTYFCRDVNKNKQIAAIMATIDDLLERQDSDSVRGISYRVEKACDHDQSDKALKEVCLLTESTRPSLNVFGTPKGLICGPIVLIANGTRIDCEEGGLSGMNIPIEAEMGEGITGVELKQELEYIFVLEKQTTFLVLKRLNFHIKNKCVLITGSGMPDIATRIVVSKLKHFLKLPVYCLVDANPFGIRIYSTFRNGSKELAFDNLGLTVSSIELIGLFPEDIMKVKKSSRKVLSDADKTCLESLLDRKYIMKDKTLNPCLKHMKKNNCKAQIECLQESLGNAGFAQYIEEKIAEVHLQAK